MAERIPIMVDDQRADVPSGCSVAAGVMQSRGLALRESVTGESRGPLCGMGVCFECRVTIDGVPHQRSCLLPCREGMKIETGDSTFAHASGSDSFAYASGSESFAYASGSDRRFVECDVLVVGAGPGGLAAAAAVAEAGQHVVIVDDNAPVGGQIWRRDSSKPSATPAAQWSARMLQGQVETLAATQIIGQLGPNQLLADTPTGPAAIRYRRLILACGARERFLPFPGWTLPGVFGAGGLQALAKSGFDVEKKKIVVAGSGPLLLAVGAYLRSRRANVSVFEQTPRSTLWRFAASLAWRQPGKLWEGLWLNLQVGLFSYHPGCWVVRADGDRQVEAVTLTDGYSTWSLPCDALACGFGLVANLELPRLLGCAIDHGIVRIDQHQQTSVGDVYAVGELTGIGGLDKAVLEGQIAGWTAAGQHDRANHLLRQRDAARDFVSLLDGTFSLRDELRLLPDQDTIVCRCEDIRFGQIRAHQNWRDAKLQTRCGMGPCQGRICGSAVEFLLGWSNESIRPPILPTALANLAAAPGVRLASPSSESDIVS